MSLHELREGNWSVNRGTERGCSSAEHHRALRALLVLGQHPLHGVDGFRLETYRGAPALLHGSLQDKLPLGCCPKKQEK